MHSSASLGGRMHAEAGDDDDDLGPALQAQMLIAVQFHRLEDDPLEGFEASALCRC